jgi:hypothetical protein
VTAGFVLDASGNLGPNPANAAGTTPARNRLVLLMNDNGGVQFPPVPGDIWQDTQIWELGAPGASPLTSVTWSLPFDVDTVSVDPPPGTPDLGLDYGIYRTTFFQRQAGAPAPLPPPASPYPDVYPPTFTPVNGTYERWYVANLGNDTTADVDMHPFHMHLVNFVVQRRWKLDGGVFKEMVGDGTIAGTLPERPLDFDRTSRHDTVRVQSNELLELLVYFPPGHTGDYVYHCHLVEHEDMGMMLHFNVT